MQELEFNKSIIPSLEESFSSAEQIERLSQLHEELSGLTQGSVILDSLESCKNDLINKKILKHKDPGVRSLSACCLSDIMRLYAPDAPFTEKELCDIFKLFFSQFRLLRDPDNGNFIQQTYLITRLLECRSIVLITDLPPSKRLIEELFQIFYEKDNNQFPSKLWKIIGGLLTEVVSECESLSMDVLRLIFNAFLNHESKESNSLKGLPLNKDSSFEFSLIICESASNRLGRHFSKFYSEILYGITNENEGIQSVLDPSYRTLTKLHKLTSYVWQYSPELVHSVIGFVYQELCSDNVPLRISATNLVADILTHQSTINFVTTHNDTFQVWLSKMADISPKVRVQWAKSLSKIICCRDDISEDIAKGLAKTLIDTDETVRLQSVRTLAHIPSDIVWARLRVDTIFKELLHLIRDKSKEVREESLVYLCTLYDDSLKQNLYNINQSRKNSKELWEVLKQIPTHVFNLYYINDPNINMQVDLMIFTKLLNLELDENERNTRLMNLVTSLDKKALASFFAFNNRQVQINKAVNSLFELNGEKLEKLINWLGSTLPSQLANDAIITKFLELKDSRISHLLKVSINQETNYPTLKNSLQELKIRLEDPDLFKKRGVRFGTSFNRETFNTTILLLAYRASPFIYNVSGIAFLLNTKKDDDEEYNTALTQIVQNISEVNPLLFKSEISSLTTLVTDNHSDSNIGKQEQLKTLYKIFKALPNEVKIEDGYLMAKLEDFSLKGNIAESKYAIKILALIPDKTKREKILSSLRSSALPLEFLTHSKHLLCNSLVILSQLFKVDFNLLKDDCNEITTFILRDLLVTNEFFKDIIQSEDTVEWIDDKQLLDKKQWAISTKLLCLELLTNRMISEAQSSETVESSLETIFHKILKLFLYFVSNGGEVINPENETKYPTPVSYQRRIRCQAGLQILKLAKVAKFNKWIESKFIFKLINLVEDESFPVRCKFVNKLKNYISEEAISIKFIPLPFFMPFEPDVKFKTDAKIWINFTFQKETATRGAIFERSLPRLLHCIAHHPDIEDNITDDANEEDFMTACNSAIDYVLFYLDTVLKPENINLLYYLTGRVKQYKDLLEDNPTCIYVISELVQMILKELKQMKNLNLSEYPGRLNLPSDLFVPFENAKLAQANTFKTFIKDDLAKKLEHRIKLKCSKMVHGSSTTIKQKRQQRQLTSEYKQTSPSKKRKHHASESESESESESDEESYNEKNVYPSPLKSSRQRKSSRARNTVNYNEEDDENEEIVI